MERRKFTFVLEREREKKEKLSIKVSHRGLTVSGKEKSKRLRLVHLAQGKLLTI